MKRFLILVAMVLFSVNAWAAGSCTVTKGNHTELTAEIIWECIGDSSDGSIPNTSAVEYSSMFTKYPYTIALVVENLAASANVTTDSDVYLDDKETGGADILEGDGVDQLDDSTRNFVRLTPNPLPQQVWLRVANQAVASGAYTVILTITK